MAHQLAPEAPQGSARTDSPADDLAVEDVAVEDLVEEVSIDGMCGVY